MRQLRGLIGFGDEGVVFPEDLGIDVIGEEVRDGEELVVVVVGHEFVVAVVQHFVGETASESVGRGAEVVINGVGAPAKQEFDNVFVNFGAEKRCGAASA